MLERVDSNDLEKTSETLSGTEKNHPGLDATPIVGSLSRPQVDLISMNCNGVAGDGVAGSLWGIEEDKTNGCLKNNFLSGELKPAATEIPSIINTRFPYPTWRLDIHPLFAFGDYDQRKQFCKEIQREVSLEDLAGDVSEEDVDDEDMVYGLDPGFTDIDEELRIVEGMIHEHTVLKEIEIADDNDENESNLNGENSQDSLEFVCVCGWVSLDSDPLCCVCSQRLENGKINKKSAQEFGNVREYDELIKESISESPRLSKRPSAEIADQVPPYDELDDDSVDAIDAGKEAVDPEIGINGLTDPADNNTASRTPPDARKGRRTKKVRIVELPDYFAAIAQEHQKHLLECRQKDLQQAAQAANDRDQSYAAAKGPRSQNMIRRGYFQRLGIKSVSMNALFPSHSSRHLGDIGINTRRAAIASARTRGRPPSMRTTLRAAGVTSKSSGILKKIASWMNQESQIADDEDICKPEKRPNGTDIYPSQHSQTSSDHSFFGATKSALYNRRDRRSTDGCDELSSAGEASQMKRVCFFDSVDVHFIPARTDYPARIRNSIWHTRTEFIEMVVKNMEMLEEEINSKSRGQRVDSKT